MQPGPFQLTQGQSVAGRYTLIGPQPDRGFGEAWIAEAGDRTRRLLKFHAVTAAQAAAAEEIVASARRPDAPGVAAFRDGGVWEGRLFLAYEPCGGRSLHDWLQGWRTTRTLPTPGTVQSIFRHLCSVVHSVHAKGHSHGHLTPRSVVLASLKAAQPLVVFDWTLGSLRSPDDRAVGADYQSPEQVDRPDAVDSKRADVFALGVILGELLTLRARPREGGRETWEQWLRARPRRLFASLGACPAEAPEAVWGLVERVLTRRDEPMSAMALRQLAREAWGPAHDEQPASLREAPTPVTAEPNGREGRPSSELRLGPNLTAEAIEARDGVTRALRLSSVPPERPSAPPPAPSIDRAATLDQTLIDAESPWRHSLPGPVAAAPAGAWKPVGGDTLLLPPTASSPGRDAPAPPEDWPRHSDPTLAHSPSDAFAHGGRSYDTLPLGDTSAALGSDVAQLRRSIRPADQTLPLGASAGPHTPFAHQDGAATLLASRGAPSGSPVPFPGVDGAANNVTIAVGSSSRPPPAPPRSIAPSNPPPRIVLHPVLPPPPRYTRPPPPPKPSRWPIAVGAVVLGGLVGVVIALLLKVV